MAAISWNRNSWHSSAMPVLVMLALVAGVSGAFAQTPEAPYALFERATLTGSGSTITAVNVPIVISSGLTIYTNVTMQFNVDWNGNLTLSSGYPQVFPSPIVLASSFKAGRYVGPSTKFSGKGYITVSGPGVSDGGATAWSFMTASGADNYTFPSNGTWYVGPIANNPYAARLNKAGITSTAWSYGLGQWDTAGGSRLIAASQTGNAITIATFSICSGCTDNSAPVDQVTFTLVP